MGRRRRKKPGQLSSCTCSTFPMRMLNFGHDPGDHSPCACSLLGMTLGNIPHVHAQLSPCACSTLGMIFRHDPGECSPCFLIRKLVFFLFPNLIFTEFLVDFLQI